MSPSPTARADRFAPACRVLGAGLFLALPLSAVAQAPAPAPAPAPAKPAVDLDADLARIAASLAEHRPQAGETLLLGLSVNGVAQEGTIRALRVATPTGLGLAVPQQLWDTLHLRMPLQPPRMIDGETHVVLDSDAQWRWRIDEPSQTLLIDAPAAAFRGQRMDLDAPSELVTLASDWGAFVNYDLQWQRRSSSRSGGAASETHDAVLEAGLFTPRGPLSSTALYRSEGRLLRLDTRWLLEQPRQMTRLAVGDSVSQPGSWGRSVRFGGLQWGTDFSLRPGFLSFPLPQLRGEAALPSTVDIFVNNSQRLQGRLQAGPFDIADMPVVTGQGEIRTVVRDLLGREQVIVQPYYVSPSLLKPGLRAFSLELGALREDYGVESNRYGPLLLSGTERLGLTDRFTRELRAELMARQQTLGAAGIWLWPRLGTATFAGAASRSREQGSGWMLSAGIDRQAQDWSGSLQLRKASRGFVQAGQSALPVPGSGLNAGLSYALSLGRSWRGQSLGLGYVRQAGPGGARLASLNYGRDLGRAGFLGLFLLKDFGPGRSATLALSWSYALDERTSTGTSLVRNQDGDAPARQQLQVQLQHNPPLGEGLGYQLLAESGGRRVAQANWQGEAVTLNAGAARANGVQDWRAGASGGVAFVGGSVYASRRVEGGLALVQVADYPDVRVWHDNQVVARTDSRGRALISGLRGYQANRVGIDSSDLPFDAELEALEVVLTPAGRSAARVDFPVQRSRAVSFRLVDAGGQPLPPGSLMELLGEARRPGRAPQLSRRPRGPRLCLGPVRRAEPAARRLARRRLPLRAAPAARDPRGRRPARPGHHHLSLRTRPMKQHRFRLCLLFLLMLLPLGSARALCVLCVCSVQTTNVAFGNYSPLAYGNTDSTGSVKVTCGGVASLLLPFKVDISAGSSGNAAARTLRNGAYALSYNLYADPAYTTILGDGSGATQAIVGGFVLDLLGLSPTQNFWIYGRLPGRQLTAAPGIYADTINVTLTYY